MSERVRQQMTIYDVAKAAGVHPSTVSRTFARPGRVNADTAERVRLAADALGYRANPIAHARGDSSTRLIAVVVSDIANPFHTQLVRGAQGSAIEAGYEILLSDARNSAARERTALERLLPVVEGVMVASSRMTDSSLRMIAKQKPMAVINRELRESPSIVSDNVGGVRAAIELLRKLGHESVVYLSGPEASWPDGMRSRAVRDLGAQAGLQTQRLGPFRPTVEGGLIAAEQLRSRPPTAIIAFNDMLAIGVIRGLMDNGIRVPEDVSVIGFDDILMAQMLAPALTTVYAPARQMGMTGMSNLVALINGARTRPGDSLVMPVRLKVRQSTGPRNRQPVRPR